MQNNSNRRMVSPLHVVYHVVSLGLQDRGHPATLSYRMTSSTQYLGRHYLSINIMDKTFGLLCVKYYLPPVGCPCLDLSQGDVQDVPL